MDKQHENRNSMHKAVDTFFIERSAKIEGSKVLKETVDSFHNLCTDIDSKLEQVIKSTNGKTAAKQQAQDEMLGSAFDIKAALLVFAGSTSNHTISDLASISDYRLARMRDTEQKVYCDSLYEAAMANLGTLADYEVTQEEAAAFRQRIDRFAATLGSREATPAEAKALRESLFMLFDNATAVLETIDELMKRFRTKDPEFYNAYKSARMVKDVGIRHRPEAVAQAQQEPAAQK
jgi:hypothetical protein